MFLGVPTPYMAFLLYVVFIYMMGEEFFLWVVDCNAFLFYGVVFEP